MFQMNQDDEVFLNRGNNQEHQTPEFNPNAYEDNVANSEETVDPGTLDPRPSTSSSSPETPSDTVSFHDF